MALDKQSYTIGTATMTRIDELTLSNFTTAALFPDWDPSVLVRYSECLQDGTTDESREHILMSVHSWLVQERGRIILIDAGVGNAKHRPYAPYFDQLNHPFIERLNWRIVTPNKLRNRRRPM